MYIKFNIANTVYSICYKIDTFISYIPYLREKNDSILHMIHINTLFFVVCKLCACDIFFWTKLEAQGCRRGR